MESGYSIFKKLEFTFALNTEYPDCRQAGNTEHGMMKVGLSIPFQIQFFQVFPLVELFFTSRAILT